MIEELTKFFYKKAILIVEDDFVSAILLFELLSQLKTSVYVSHTACDALNVFNQTPNLALVLLDIRLKDGCGYDLAIKMKKIKPNIIIVAQTALATKQDEYKLRAAFNELYIFKPLSELLLFTTINQAVNSSK